MDPSVIGTLLATSVLPLLLAVFLTIGLLFARFNRSKVRDISALLANDEFAGKNVLVTGASSGIGAASAVEFASRGATVSIVVRSQASGNHAVQFIRSHTSSGHLIVCPLDLSCLGDVVKFCSAVEGQFDILVNNAGVFAQPFSRTEEGHESTLASNYLGHFLLTCLLLSRGHLAPDARIVFVTGAMYKWGSTDVGQWDEPTTELEYSALSVRGFNLAYSNSKLAMCLFGIALHKTFHSSGRATESVQRQQVFMVHPGVVSTKITRHLLINCPKALRSLVIGLANLVMLNSQEGCQGILGCAAGVEGFQSGNYYHNCCWEPWPAFVTENRLLRDCWRHSVELVESTNLEPEGLTDELYALGIQF